MLIAICWLTYTCSYIGKLGYNANIIRMESTYGISHSTAGMVSTFFFFAYGVGQIFNGIMCKRYPLRIVVFCALLTSALCNLAVGLLDNFDLIKFVWLVNGFALSILWPSLIRFLSERVAEGYMRRAILAMGTTVAIGTFLIYGMSALFNYLGNFKTVFYIAAGLLPAVGVVWLVFYPKGESGQTAETEVFAEKKRLRGSGLTLSVVVIAVFAVVSNLTKDGLTTWVPSMLNELYDMPSYTSILLSLVLPVLAVFGATLAVLLNKKIKVFTDLISIIFAFTAVLIAIVIAFLSRGAVLPLVCFALVSLTMSAVNNIITSMAPLKWKDRLDAGSTAGILNGCCYAGSTISSYGLGLVADHGGWNSVFVLIFALLAVCVTIGGAIFIFRQISEHKKEHKAD